VRQPGSRYIGQPRVPDEELARDACLGMIYHLLSNSSEPSNGDNWERKRALLLADYARRSKELPPELQCRLDRAVIRSFDAARGPMDVADLILPKEAAVDVAVITILADELKATLHAFGIAEQPQGTQPFYETQVSCQGRPGRALDVVITSAAKPLNVHVGAPIARLRNKYSPSAVFLVGIAGGRRQKTKQGDVVIAQRVFYYEPGRVTSKGKAPRPQWAEPRNYYGNGLYYYDPSSTAFNARISEFIAGLPAHHRPPTLSADHAPEIYRANTTIATGESVLRDGNFLEDLAQRFDDTICAVDEEAYGFADAVRDLPWAIFRGISDTADETQEDRWMYPAAGFAAICLRDFLETYYVPPDVAEL
jgi:nucleoside phosphorylase